MCVNKCSWERKKKPLEGLCNLKSKINDVPIFFKKKERKWWFKFNKREPEKRELLKTKAFLPFQTAYKRNEQNLTQIGGELQERKQRPILENILHYQIIWSALSPGAGENTILMDMQWPVFTFLPFKW